MPTRRGVVLILLFWLATTGYVGYRDVWPHLFADAAPTAWIDLSDEATQTVPVRWALFRNDRRVGGVSTQMSYDTAAEAFRFVTKYRGDLGVDVLGVNFRVPEYEMTMTLARDGTLRRQQMRADFAVTVPLVGTQTGTAAVDGDVKDGQLVGTCKLVAPALGTIEEPLPPTPAPEGQVLNPLQPVNRLRGVRPGMRWVIHAVNPMGAAVAGIKNYMRQKGIGKLLLSDDATGPRAMIATVGDQPEVLKLTRGDAECWVIDIRGDRGTTAVWVRVSDGFVMRQVAKLEDETLRLDREE